MRKNGIYKKCLICTKPFYVIKARLNKAKFCSFDCKYKWSKSIVPWNKNLKMSEEWKKEKMSFSHLKKWQTGQWGFKKGNIGYWKGKKRPEFSQEWKNKIGLANKGDKSFFWGKDNSGSNNPSWKGGLSLNPYPKEFNRSLKLRIRTRDNFICCLCKKTEKEEIAEFGRVLCVNHIDFNKSNCSEINLNTLCLRCNIFVNKKRQFWTNFFIEQNKNILYNVTINNNFQ